MKSLSPTTSTTNSSVGFIIDYFNKNKPKESESLDKPLWGLYNNNNNKKMTLLEVVDDIPQMLYEDPRDGITERAERKVLRFCTHEVHFLVHQ